VTTAGTPRHLTSARQRAAKLEALGHAAAAWAGAKTRSESLQTRRVLLRAALEYGRAVGVWDPQGPIDTNELEP